MLPAILALILAIGQVTQTAIPRPKPVDLVFEGATDVHFTRTNDHVQLNAGRGWLRLPAAHADFELTCEFRLTQPDSEAHLVLQGWERGDVKVRLPRPGRESRNLVDGDGARVTVESLGQGAPGRDVDGWNRLRLRIDRRQLTVVLNDVETGRYGIDEFAGYVRFHAKKGGVQLRWISAQPLVRDMTEAVQTMGAKDVLSPRIEREVKPDYTAEAMRAKIQGVVEVEAIVMTDGTVGQVRVVQSLDPGLDQQAVAAVRQWRFVPGARNGRLVPVLVNIQLTFKIKA